MSDNANRPAHPCDPVALIKSAASAGLTKREAFAMAAMQGMLAGTFENDTWEKVARYSVQIADALLMELDKPKEAQS